MLSKIERLNLLVSHYANGNKAAFARMLEMPRQSLNNWYIHESFDIEKLYRVCAGVSAEWLLTGEGEMLAKARPIEATNNSQANEIDNKDKLSQIYNSLERIEDELKIIREILNSNNNN